MNKLSGLYIFAVMLLCVFCTSPVYSDVQYSVYDPNNSEFQVESATYYGDFWCIDPFPWAIAFFAVHGGIESFARISPGVGSTWIESTERKLKEPAIPFVRYDSASQFFWGNAIGLHQRLEAGAGAVAFEVEYNAFASNSNNIFNPDLFFNPDQRISWLNMSFLYRMSFTQYFEVDWGFGYAGLLDAPYEQGVSFSMPIHVFPTEFFGIEYRPKLIAFENIFIDDHILTTLWTLDFASFQFGYRWVNINGGRANGPFMGFSLHL